MQIFRSMLVGAASTLVAASSAAAANLVVNGSFETPVISNPPGFVVFGTGNPGITGWTINSGDVDVDRAGLLGTTATAAEGNQWLDLNGFVRGNISQNFATTPGQTYHLEFFYSDNPFNNGNGSQQGVPKTGTFSLRDATNPNFATNLILLDDFTHSTATGANFDWTEFDVDFVAVSTLTRLAFAGDLDSGSTGPFIDAVSVTVPEPGTLSLLGAGLLAWGYCRRRRAG
jgi:hypothetical protein